MTIPIDLGPGRWLAIDQQGDEAAPAVILLHGLSGHRRTWDPVAEHLGRHYVDSGQIQVLLVDLRGHGESSRATLDTYDAVSYASDIAALVETLHPAARPVAVVGHSLGGVTAAVLASTRPDLVRGVLLEDPPLFEGDDERRAASPVARFFPAFVAAVRDLQARSAPPEDYRSLVEPVSAPDEVDDRCRSLHLWDPTTMEAAVSGVVWRGYDPDAVLGCPVTVMRADPGCGAVFEPGDAERFAGTNPDAEIVMVPGASHTVHAMPTLPVFLRHLDIFLANL